VFSQVAVGNAAETIYMVTSGTHMNGGCCFDVSQPQTYVVSSLLTVHPPLALFSRLATDLKPQNERVITALHAGLSDLRVWRAP
jgi:hypothetical protein